ncbi:MAG: phosphoribosylamine--glycine ligase, partial [Neisseriaceae bacterium]|nr:phosphoribosylamine--glycine ligase [Neisseriaceae bacterium]
MNILVIGSGGREHAMAWKIAQSQQAHRVFVAPGNVGTALNSRLTNVPLTDIVDLIEFAKQNAIDFTVVGPEAPLSKGIVDAFEAQGLAIFGPTQYAAQLESSKDFAKQFMQRHGIPTAAHQTFTNAALAHDYIENRPLPIVIKADGLAAGKGVVVAETLAAAHAAVDDMLLGNRLGAAGARVVIEDFLSGEEASFIVMVDGENVFPLATSQDHKRLQDGDQGPNTGGMGAYSPAPVVTQTVHQRAMEQVILPVVRGMAAEGHPFKGFLYAGLMINAQEEVSVVEFNCRLGDPETQPILMRLQSDFVDLLQAGVTQRLNQVQAQWDERLALAVVLAAKNYPAKPITGHEISGLEKSTNADVQVFHSGTANNEVGQIVTAGGRVLCVAGLGGNIKAAQAL